MTAYTLIHIDLNDPNSYSPTGLPSAGDSVDGPSISARGTLSVNEVTNFDLTFGTVTANHANFLTVGNLPGAGGPAAVTINGNVDGGAFVYKNGSLTAQTVNDGLKINGGQVDLSAGLSVTSVFGLSMTGGHLTVDGALVIAAAASIFASQSAIIDIDSLSLGAGSAEVDLQAGSVMNISSAGPLSVDVGDMIIVNGGAQFNGAGLDAAIKGEIDIDELQGVGQATLASANVDGGELRVRGGKLTVSGDITNTGVVDVSSGSTPGARGTLIANNLTVGDATASVDDCGNWTYTGESGLLPIGTGYVSVQHTLTLDSAIPSGFGLLSGGSLEVGGNHGAVTGRLLVDQGGTIVGQGSIGATSIVNNGLIEAKEGRLDLTGDFSSSSNGTVQIDDKAVVLLHDAFHGTLDFNDTSASYFTTAALLSSEQYSKVKTGIKFTGELAGLSKGVTLEVGPNTWGSLAQVAEAHAEMTGSNLVVRLSNNKTVSYHLKEAASGEVVNFRILPNGHLGLTVGDATAQIKTGISGHPTGNDYVDALIAGWAKWDPSQGPITYFFGEAGDVHDAVGEHGETSIVQCDNPQVFDWTDEAKDAFAAAREIYSSVSGLVFQEAASVESANLVWWAVDNLGAGTDGSSDAPAYMPSGHLWQYFDNALVNDAQKLEAGGLGRELIAHELGHALGLAHPHDGGAEPDRNAFPGVGNEASAGTNGQNQRVFTVMSYLPGWNGMPSNSETFGDQAGLGAFDIAALQKLYGANNTATVGPDVYQLPDVNALGTGWFCIWDAGGTDTISNAGSNVDAFIDLRAAPLEGPNAGGYISHGDVIAGGFTIANGAVIENAIGGNGGDFIIGNGVANELHGGGGGDTLRGGGGADLLFGEAGADIFDFDAKTDAPKGTVLDVIEDFSGNGGDGDQIDLSSIDAESTIKHNQAFKFIGTQKFHHKAGELHFITLGTFISVEGDVNGDGKADFKIDVHNLTNDLTAVVADDFLM